MIPTRYGQKFDCGVFVGVHYIGNTAVALYVPHSNLNEYSVVSCTDLQDAGYRSIETTRTDGIRNAEILNIPELNQVREKPINGHNDWYMPSSEELRVFLDFLYRRQRGKKYLSPEYLLHFTTGLEKVVASEYCFHSSTICKNRIMQGSLGLYYGGIFPRSASMLITARLIPMRRCVIANVFSARKSASLKLQC